MLELKLLAFAPNLNENTRIYCARREAKFPYFREGFVDLGLGRHVHHTDAIMEASQGFAIADAQGKVLGRYKTAANAQTAIDRAQPRFVSDIELEQEDEVESIEAVEPKARGRA